MFLRHRETHDAIPYPLYSVRDDAVRQVTQFRNPIHAPCEAHKMRRIAFEDPQTTGNAREVDVAAYEDIYRNAFSRGKR